PDVNEMVKDFDGELMKNPLNLARLLWRLKFRRPKHARLLLLGVKEEYRASHRYGTLAAVLYVEVARRGAARGYVGGELSWTLAERPHNLLAISDLHLGCDLRPGNRLDKPRPADGPLASFLRHHAAQREGGKPWRLILNGDIVDFVAITLVPKEPVLFEISREE